MKLNQWIGLCFVALMLFVSLYHAPYPEQMYLQHIPTITIILIWPFFQRRINLSLASSVCLWLFLVLHIIGARYIYSYVPYDKWFQSISGATLTDLFSFKRNHYDRLVHFSFGLLVCRPVFEILQSKFGLSNRLGRYVAVEFILAVSALYELFEWLLTILLAGKDADAYNGQQGDIWDAHKDMALAFLGALCAIPFLGKKSVVA